MRTTDALIVTAVLAICAPALAQANDSACAEDWRECAGQPWVDGDRMETPLGSKWWPNPLWGAGDEAGSTNWYLKPEVVLRAISTIQHGRTLKLGHEYSAAMPLYAGREFEVRVDPVPTGGPVGASRNVWNDEMFKAPIGQVGTQFDGLGHLGVKIADGDEGMRWYNGFHAGDLRTSEGGLGKLGTEKLHPIVARGILLDIAAARGVESMKAGEIVTRKDIEAALELQGRKGFEFREGDAILFRTGWEKYWIVDNDTYNDGAPGIGVEVARWVAEDVKAGVTGGDTWPVEAVCPAEGPCDMSRENVFSAHAFLQTRHGIVNQENLKLSELAKKGVYVFAYIYTPVPVTGATGSIGSPIAVW
jgi:kynurenine formamidase